MTHLPKGLQKADFDAAIKKFAATIGQEWVFTSDDDVALYRDAYSPFWGEAEERLVSAAVAPDTTEQVQAIVTIANEHRIPLFPISTGKNLGYGGSAPTFSGSVIVDLKRMNRILEVDDRRHFALVEPGVSYFDLYRHIQEHDLKVIIDTPDPGWGSVVGNALDHGVGYTYGGYRDHFGSHCGMEVVLGNGEVIRTGMGALPNAKTWQEYRYGFGPTVDGLFAQGNFGIVTKMGIWLSPRPQAYLSGMVTVPKRQDLIPLVDAVNYLEDSGLIGQPEYGSPLSPGFGGSGPPDKDLMAMLGQNTPPSDEAIEAYASRAGKHVWQVNLQFYGPVKTCAANWEHAKEYIAEAIPLAKFTDGEGHRFPLSEEEKAALKHKVALGVPNLAIFFIGARTPTNPTPQDGHLWFASVVPRTGEAVLEAQRVLTPVYREFNLRVGSFLQTPATWHPRTFIMIVGFPISREDKEANKRSIAAFRRVAQVSAEHGWGEYRSPAGLADVVAGVYSFHDHSLLRFFERLKDAADPNGILAAGRGGVWPKYLRDSQNKKGK